MNCVATQLKATSAQKPLARRLLPMGKHRFLLDGRVAGVAPAAQRLSPMGKRRLGEAVERIVVTGKPSPELGTELDRRTSGRKPEN